MTAFLIKRRMDLGWIAPAGSLIASEDIETIHIQLLVDRGYIVAVPDDYPGEFVKPPVLDAEPEVPSQAPQTTDKELDPTTSQLPPADFIPASTPGVDLPKTIDLSDVGA